MEIAGFAFPLGAYPVEPMEPRAGYQTDFEPADGDDESGEWEAWPDRYVYDAVVPAGRLAMLVRSLFALLPPRVFPILDFMGHDAYREIDPYIAYELVGLDRLLDGLRRFEPFLIEDGLVGFGAVCDDPFIYVFIDEHKIVTIRAESALTDKVEAVLRAYDLEAIEDPAGADAAAHEHRSVLLTPRDRPDLLTPEEIVEELRDRWRLILNVDPTTNTDDDGNDLGPTPFRCLIRCETISEDSPASGKPGKHREGATPGQERVRYAEVLLVAANLEDAHELALRAVSEMVETDPIWSDHQVIASDRLLAHEAAKLAADDPNLFAAKNLSNPGIVGARWLAPQDAE